MLLTRSYLTAEDAADDAVAPRPGHELAVATGRHVEVVNVLTDATEAVANRDVAALATLVGGDAQELEAIYGMLDLFLLISRDEWQEATEPFNYLPIDYAVDQCCARIGGHTTFAHVCASSAPPELVQLR